MKRAERRRIGAWVAAGALLAGLVTGKVIVRNLPEPDVPQVGDTFDGQIVFQVNDDGSFLTAPDVPCKHEDGSDQELPCVWRAQVRGNLQGKSYIMMPTESGDGEPIYFD